MNAWVHFEGDFGSAIHTKWTIYFCIVQKIEWNNEPTNPYQLPYHIQMTISVYDICSVLAGLETKVVSGGMNYNMCK